MEQSLSPGPWSVDRDCGNESVLDADGFMVADCCIFSLRDDFSQRMGSNIANARAIAALPSLLQYITERGETGCATAKALIAQAIEGDDT